MEQLATIAKLFLDNEKILTLLVKLSDIGIIAGGSVVYALHNDTTVSESVGDIDIFFNTKETFYGALKILRHAYNASWLSYYTYKTPTNPVPEGKNVIPVITVVILGERVSFQFIYKEYASPNDLFHSFDFDYVQCGVYKKNLYQTKESRIAHANKALLTFRDFRFNSDRLLKANNKGFMCPILSDFDPNKPELTHIEYHQIIANKRKMVDVTEISKFGAYFDVVNQGVFLFDALVVCGFRFTKEWQPSVYVGKFLICCGNDKIIEKDLVSIEIDVIDVDEYGIVSVRDECLNKIFKKIKLENKRMIMNEGKNTVLIQSYKTTHREFDDLTAKIVKVGSGNMLPIALSTEFELKGFGFDWTIYTKEKPQYYKIIKEMYMLRHIKMHKLIEYKISAYECFLFHAKKDGEKLAIELACQQIRTDAIKINACAFQRTDKPFQALARAFRPDTVCETVDDMMEYMKEFYH